MHYSAYGMAIESEIDLPELHPHLATSADLLIRRGRVLDLEDPAFIGTFVRTRPGALRFEMEGLGRLFVREGREIVVDPDPEVDPAEFRLYVLGTGLRAILFQRGSLPLHGCGVVHEGRALVFTGPNGVGKSTTAEAFRRKGHPVMTDDICVLEGEMGRGALLPGSRELKLWRDVLEVFGVAPGDRIPLATGHEKYREPHAGFPEPAPVRGVIHLDIAPSSAWKLRRLSGMERLDAVASNIHAGPWGTSLVDKGDWARGLLEWTATGVHLAVLRPLEPVDPEGLIDRVLTALEGDPTLA